ncbi:MAG: hypothetical protein K1X64_04395 [Myxococcaceae bacterium]|nr:hypothetical protein [Myxococcaceae bacterium]
MVCALKISLGAVRISSQLSCPSASQVEASVAALVGEGARASSPRAVFIKQAAQGIRVEMRGSADELLGERTVPAALSCDDAATAIAVIITAWEAQVPPQIPPVLKLSRPLPPPPVQPAPKARAIEVGLGLGVSMAPAAVASYALSAGLDVSFGSPERGWGGLITATGNTQRRVPLGPGSVGWQRFELAAGPRYRLTTGTPHVDFYAQATGALLLLNGSGFTDDTSSRGFDFGAAGGIRSLLTQGPIAPWVKLEAKGWLRRQEARVTFVDGFAVVPNFELSLVAGAAWMSP